VSEINAHAAGKVYISRSRAQKMFGKKKPLRSGEATREGESFSFFRGVVGTTVRHKTISLSKKGKLFVIAK